MVTNPSGTPRLRAVYGLLIGAALVALAGGWGSLGSDSTALDQTAPPGPDTGEPFPIDRGADGPHTPGTYKGLPLRLVERPEPAVTAVDGRIGIVCVGMSNARLECEHYGRRLAQALNRPGSQINPRIRFVNCAVGGHAVERWIDPAFDEATWTACLEHKVRDAGLQPDQIRVLLHKAANQFTTYRPDGAARVRPPYPDPDSDFFQFQANLSAFADRVPEVLPNVQAVYTSSRIYGGFAPPHRGEPLSYEEGHALNRWLSDHPQVAGVWYGWGPYLWAPDCASGVRNGQGYCYERADFVADGVHPSPSGCQKVAEMWHARLLQETWYRR